MQYYWDDIIGHTKIITQLEKDILNQNLAHAYLFAGPAEIGKYTIAKKFANILICPHNYCRSCKDCHQFKQNLHPDIITVNQLWIENEFEDQTQIALSSNFNQIHRTKTPKAKTDTLSIDDLRSFSQKIYEKKYGRYKICLIKNIERLHESGANAFLKLLEEPPQDTIFILTSSFPEKILETMLSRVRKINFGNVPDSVITQKIQQTHTHPQLEEIITLAQGRPSVALKLLNNPTLLETEKNRFHQIAQLVSKKNLNHNFALAEKLSNNSAECLLFLDGFIRFIRTLLLEKTKNNSTGLSLTLSYPKLLSLLEEAQITKNNLQKNINKRLLLENFMLHLN